MNKVQSTIKTVIYAIFAVIVGLILIRLLLKFIGANPNNEFAIFWYDFTYIFVEPWAVIYPSFVSGRMILEVYSLVAMLFYISFSMIAEKGASSPFEDSAKKAIAEIIDAIFKVIEFLLVTRFIFKLTAASTSASFVRFIYDLSGIVYEPFASLMPAIAIDKMRIEISTLIALIIVIILDLVTNQLVVALLNSVFPDRPKKKKVVNQVNIMQPAVQTVPVAVPVQMQPPLQPAMAQPQHININIPPQQVFYPNQNTVNMANGNRNTNPKPVKKQVGKAQKRGFLNWAKKRSSRQGGPANS